MLTKVRVWYSEIEVKHDEDSNENYICIKDSKTEITQRDCPGTNEQTMGIFENYKEE